MAKPTERISAEELEARMAKYAGWSAMTDHAKLQFALGYCTEYINDLLHKLEHRK